MSKIIYMDYFLPQKNVAAEAIMNKVNNILIPEGYTKKDFIDDFIYKTNLKDISIADDENLVDVFSDLVSNFLKETTVDVSKIRYIFYTNPLNLLTNNNVSIPYCIQKKFNMDEASVVVLDQKCSTTLQTLNLTRLFGEIYKDEYILILSPCFINENDDAKRFIQFSICGDAAGIMVIGNNKKIGFNIVDGISKSDGGFSYNSHYNLVDVNSTFTDVDDRLNIINKGIDVIKQLLEKNKISMDEVTAIIPQSVNKHAYYIYSIFLKIDVNKIFTDSIPKGGHLGDVDTIRNLKDFQRNIPLKRGDYVVLYGLGSDGTDINYNAILCKYDI